MTDETRNRALASAAADWVRYGTTGDYTGRLRDLQHAAGDPARLTELLTRACIAGLLAGRGAPPVQAIVDILDPDLDTQTAAYRSNLIFFMALEDLAAPAAAAA